MTDQNIFNNEPTPQVEGLDALVGPGKKFATVEDLARGYVASQQYIPTLEQENAQYRDKIQEGVTLQQQIHQLQNRQVTPPSEPREPPRQEPEQRENQADDLAERIRQVTREERENEKRTNNLNQVSERLVEVYGSTEAARKAVAEKAQELGVSVQFLMDSATQSPKAFYVQLGLNEQPRSTVAPRTQVNTAALQNSNQPQAAPGTYKYYDEMRKSDPARWRRAETQLEIHEQAQKNPNFFG